MYELKKKRKYKKNISSSRKGRKGRERGSKRINLHKTTTLKVEDKNWKNKHQEKKSRKTFPSPVSSLLLLISYLLLNLFTIHHLLLPFPHLVVVIFVVFVVILIFSFFFFPFFVKFLFFFYSIYVGILLFIFFFYILFFITIFIIFLCNLSSGHTLSLYLSLFHSVSALLRL